LSGRAELSLRKEVREAVEQARSGDLKALEALIAQEPRVIRHLLSLSYQADRGRRAIGVRGLAIASRHHPKLIQEVVRRLVWAMNDESGTNALTAPEVILALADENPELLLPAVPDLTRLTQDSGLREGLVESLKRIAAACPGEVGNRLAKSLNRRLTRR
jgi:hypothetical protein